MGRKAALHNLGCKVNAYEAEAMRQMLEKAGYEIVPFAPGADVYVINTCTVTETSNKKSRGEIRKVHRINPDARIIVAGCYAQMRPDEVRAIPGVARVFLASEKHLVVPETLNTINSSRQELPVAETVFSAYSTSERTRAFLKVQDGCNYFCSYCAIPYARGRSRSVPLEVLLEQAKNIAEKGVKEIVLTGVNIGDYQGGLLDVMKALDKIGGIERYRISSIEPNLLTDSMIDWIASGTKFQPHFHIPLQSGCNSTLERMHRRYDTELFAGKIDYIRKKMGDVFFGIDVIAGFPGETDSEFSSTLEFLGKRISPAFLHIFPYSRRKGTLADKMDSQVPERVKSLRVKALETLSDELHGAYVKRFEGTVQKVLFEGRIKGSPAVMGGYTGNYIRVERPYDASAIGRIVEVTL